jgi:hypothetical protein
MTPQSEHSDMRKSLDESSKVVIDLSKKLAFARARPLMSQQLDKNDRYGMYYKPDKEDDVFLSSLKGDVTSKGELDKEREDDVDVTTEVAEGMHLLDESIRKRASFIASTKRKAKSKLSLGDDIRQQDSFDSQFPSFRILYGRGTMK